MDANAYPPDEFGAVFRIDPTPAIGRRPALERVIAPEATVLIVPVAGSTRKLKGGAGKDKQVQ